MSARCCVFHAARSRREDVSPMGELKYSRRHRRCQRRDVTKSAAWQSASEGEGSRESKCGGAERKKSFYYCEACDTTNNINHNFYDLPSAFSQFHNSSRVKTSFVHSRFMCCASFYRSVVWRKSRLLAIFRSFSKKTHQISIHQWTCVFVVFHFIAVVVVRQPPQQIFTLVLYLSSRKEQKKEHLVFSLLKRMRRNYAIPNDSETQF